MKKKEMELLDRRIQVDLSTAEAMLVVIIINAFLNGDLGEIPGIPFSKKANDSILETKQKMLDKIAEASDDLL